MNLSISLSTSHILNSYKIGENLPIIAMFTLHLIK